MKKEDVLNWCEENNFILIDLSKKEIPMNVIFKIAMEATGVKGEIIKYNRKPEYSFARYMAANYLDKYYATGVLAEKLNLNHSLIDYARKTMATDIKYFKQWQQNAINYFNDKISEIEKYL